MYSLALLEQVELCHVVNFESTGWAQTQNPQHDNCCHVANFVSTPTQQIQNLQHDS